MAIETVVSGAFTKTWNAVDVGFNKDGFSLEFNFHAEEIKESDLYGESLLDMVYRGGTHRLEFISRVYKAGSTAPFAPWGALGTIWTAAAPVARLASAVAQSFVGTAVANTPTATSPPGPATLTASKSILAPNANLKLLFSSKAREVPVRLVCLPTDAIGTGTAFATTAWALFATGVGMLCSVLGSLSNLA